MPKTKKQKVRFHKGDKRPGGQKGKLSYNTKLVKRGRKMVWQVIEQPTNSVINEYFFEEDAKKIVDFGVEWEIDEDFNMHEIDVRDWRKETYRDIEFLIVDDGEQFTA